MEIQGTQAGQQSIFKVITPDRKEGFVHARHLEEAALIDTSNDGTLQDDEIKAHMRKIHLLKDPNFFKADVEQMVSDYKSYLQNQPAPQDAAYHTYESMAAELRDLATAHPDRAELVSLGKTIEGRDIWALHISSNIQGNTLNKPGVVFTGNHHAREWASMEVPLHLATTLVNEYDTNPDAKRRVDNADIWVIPMVNPDGYEYSRTEDRWWRKNRNPVTNVDTGCGNIAGCNLPSSGAERGGSRTPEQDGQGPIPSLGSQPERIVGWGVDLNRNYYDGKPEHAHLYRPHGDLPCNTWDDFGWATSDDPDSDTYRGPRGGSERETQAMMQLELGRENIRGIIDHHGYGEMLLRPWGHTTEPPANIRDYDEVAARMRDAQSTKYRYMSGTDLYPTSGSSEDTQHANGKYTFTIELGTSFQPPVSALPGLKANVGAADFAFLDWIIEKFPVQQEPPAPEPPPSEPPAPEEPPTPEPPPSEEPPTR